MTKKEIEIGGRVKSLEDFLYVKAGTEGIIIEDYGTGIMIAWDLPNRPIPKNKTLEEIATMPATHIGCPLRDGFDKEIELQFLERI